MRNTVLEIEGHWTRLFDEPYKSALEDRLPQFLTGQRWFGGKARRVQSVLITETVKLPYGQSTAVLAMVAVTYRDGQPETYVLSIAYATDGNTSKTDRDFSDNVIARVHINGKQEEGGVLIEALDDRDFCHTLLDTIVQSSKLRGESGEMIATPTPALESLLPDDVSSLDARVLQAEQSNTSVLFGDKLILKLFRRTEEGINSDLEVGRFLTEKAKFTHAPEVAGAIEYRRPDKEPITVAMLQRFVPNNNDAWGFTLDSLHNYFDRALTSKMSPDDFPMPDKGAHRFSGDLPEVATKRIGSYLTMAELLGQRTGELHVALASGTDDDFAPEPFTIVYQRSLYESVRARNTEAFDLLRRRADTVPQELQEDMRAVLALEPEMERRTKLLLDHPMATKRIRCHGDYHLGQVLYTGDDFVIIDFEGEPLRSIGERRLKISPMRDVAGMLRSFHYASVAALKDDSLRGRSEAALKPWASIWHRWVCAVFLRAYEKHVAAADILPASAEDFAVLLDVFLLEKAAYELEYELNNRPDWLLIPLRGLRNLLGPL